MRPITVTVSNASSGVQYSNWVRTDDFAPASMSMQFNVTGTVNYTIEMTNDDPNSATNPVAVGSMTWSSLVSPVIGATANAQATMAVPFLFYRITLNSGSGSVTGTFVQYSNGPK